MWLPMSCYMTLPKLKSQISSFAGGVNRKNDDTIILIDDMHLQSNINVNVLDYLRMWAKNRGHHNVPSKSFDSLCNLKTLMTFDLKYGLQSFKKEKNIDISKNRYTFYSHMIYIPPIHRSKVKHILQKVASYRLDLMYDHPLTGLHVPLIHSLMCIDEYFRKNVTKLKYSQFNNPNSITTKKLVLETLLTRALEKQEEIDSTLSVAQVLMSLTSQFYLLRVLDPSTKIKMEKDIGEIIIKEFKLTQNDLQREGLHKKDIENLKKVKEQLERLSKSASQTTSSSKKTGYETIKCIGDNFAHESKRILEQIECGIQNHLIVSPTNVPVEDIIKVSCQIGGYSFFPVFNSKLVSRYFDAHLFKTALQSSIKATKKGMSKKVVVYISDSHHSDISYADLLN